MNKRLVVSVVFVILVIVVAISFSSYQANLLEMHDKTKYLEKIAAKQSPLLNLENGSHPLGSENASVTIVEFGDYQCEACYYWFHNTRASLIDNYIETGKAKLVFVDLPFLGRDSPKAHKHLTVLKIKESTGNTTQYFTLSRMDHLTVVGLIETD